MSIYEYPKEKKENDQPRFSWIMVEMIENDGEFIGRINFCLKGIGIKFSDEKFNVYGSAFSRIMQCAQWDTIIWITLILLNGFKIGKDWEEEKENKFNC